MRKSSALILAAFFVFCLTHISRADTEGQLEQIRKAIQQVENDLLRQSQRKETAASQLKKIKELLSLQKKEITISQRRIREMSVSLQSLLEQKENLQTQLSDQKQRLYLRLKELNAFTEIDLNDAHWLETFDVLHQREQYLSKVAEKDLKQIESLKKNTEEVLALELKLIEEKGRLDFYVQELKEQNELMGANEQIQRELLLSSRASRLEALKGLHELRTTESELQGILKKVKKSEPTGFGFAKQKGRLPMPVEGKILTGFGRSYDKKTNLFTFQKGVTIASSSGTPVKAVDAGKIAYAGPLKNYRNIVIVEHAGHYYSLYGQLSRIEGKEGDLVSAAQVVGHSSEEPMYFEIRNKNIAVNPAQWLKGSSQ